jgi:hypothetical protein
MARSEGEQVAAATARVRAYWTARADCAETTAVATKRKTAAITRIETRVFTCPPHFRSRQPRRLLAGAPIARNPIHALRLAGRPELANIGKVTSNTPSRPALADEHAKNSTDLRTWVETTRAIRWALALALVLGALAVGVYWLVAGTRLACQVVTVTTGTGTTTTQTCGLPDTTDLLYVLAAVVVLLIPDAQRLRIGGFEFERLSDRIEEQTHEISQLRQTVSTTVNIGSDLINQARNGFRETKDILDRVRTFLPQTPAVLEQLATVDQLEARAAHESWPDLFAGIMTMHNLIDAAARASADALVRTSEAADTPEEEAQAEEAGPVISDYLG